MDFKPKKISTNLLIYCKYFLLRLFSKSEHSNFDKCGFKQTTPQVLSCLNDNFSNICFPLFSKKFEGSFFIFYIICFLFVLKDLYGLISRNKKSIQSGVFSSKVWDSIKGIEKGTEEYEIFFSQLNQLPTFLPGLSKLEKGNKQDQLNAFHQYFRLILFQFGYNTISLLKSWIKVMKLHLSSNHIQMTNEFEMLLDVFVEKWERTNY